MNRLERELRRELGDAGLDGWFLVRDLLTGEEIGLDPDVTVPAASLVKVPLGLTVLDRIAAGELDPAASLPLEPGGGAVPGPPGVPQFRHPVAPALEDVLYLAVALSDNAAADALLTLVSPDDVTAWLRAHGIDDLVVRHDVGELGRTPIEAMPETPELALTLATRGGTAGSGHRVRQLDVGRASTTTARAQADLLSLVWQPDGGLDEVVAARMRQLLGQNVMRQRLWPDFASDSTTWSSKTGTLLTLRHEAGVVEHADGAQLAVVALTSSRVTAVTQPAAEATAGSVARRLHDHLRGRT